MSESRLARLSPGSALRLVKVIHTVAWAFFSGCILAIPIAAWRADFAVAIMLAGMVLVECVVLAANGMRCPLTDVAARYTDDRRDNFDIYLPVWLARNNKRIFGWLFVAGLLLTGVRWFGW
jgi:hypothetical protein